MICKNCGKEINEASAFCPLCGAKQVDIYTKVFTRNGLSEDEFIKNINKWFQLNPKIANVKCKFETDTSIGLLANKYQLNTFTVEYELFEKNNINQYALTKEECYNVVSKKTKDFVEEWKQSHPNVKVVNWQGGTHSRGQTGTFLIGGFGAANRLNVYLFYKFARKED